MTQEIVVELEEKDVIKPIADELGTPSKPPLTGGHLPFTEMGIVPPADDRVMDVCNVTFDQLKKRILQGRLS